ncbi:cytochrome P450 [Nodosilinea sp. FACHB-131]|uniref:cytochrome P450 n=1 Tax=Cyanophyceae TaxID=3028117 RepID=UPI0016864C86|nr:cytochrome P450 [Nodosilinea sp. FACHB-131]MBD1875671.1 cytochrome P450 [Nodosilinea sp. FACHB-131]
MVASTPLPLPPGSFGLPVVGETLNFLFDREFAKKRQAKYGAIFKTRLLGRPTVVLMGAEANKFVLSTHMDSFSWREGWPGTFKQLLGESLFLQEGEEHRRNRKLLMPAFHGPALAGYVETMQSLTECYAQRWEDLGQFTWFDELKQLTFDIASTLLLGSEPGSETAQLSKWFTELTNGLFAPPIRWGWTPFGRAVSARDKLLNHIEQVIKERQAHPTHDALGLLVQSEDEEGNRLSLEEIKAQALLMLFAGHETTTSMLTSLVMALAQHPEVWEQARQEQARLMETSDGPSGPVLDHRVTLEQIRQMPYLDQIVKEVERLYPPVGGGFRGVVKDFEFNGYRVPAGWMALYRIDAAHRDRTIYTDPDRFDPDRFSPERAEHKRADFSLVGFGGGPRICLGLAFAQLEIKLVAAHLLRHYTWDLVPDQNLEMTPIPTLRPRSGLKVVFKKRDYAQTQAAAASYS